MTAPTIHETELRAGYVAAVSAQRTPSPTIEKADSASGFEGMVPEGAKAVGGCGSYFQPESHAIAQTTCAVCDKALCECLDHHWKGAFIDTVSDDGAWADAMLFPPYAEKRERLERDALALLNSLQSKDDITNQDIADVASLGRRYAAISQERAGSQGHALAGECFSSTSPASISASGNGRASFDTSFHEV